MSNVVGLDTDKVARLAGQCDTAACELARLRAAARDALSGAGGDPTAVRALADAEDWLAGEARRLRDLVARVLAWDRIASALPFGFGIELWRHGDHPSYTDPRQAHAAGLAAVAAARAGDRDSLARLLRAWAGDPVFASVVAANLPPALVAAELELLAGLLPYPADDEQRVAQQELVGALAATLATASSVGGSIDFAAVVDAVRALGAPTAVVGLLFLEPAPWSAEALVAAVEAVVAPVNDEVAERGPVGVAYLRDGLELVDPRVLVLAALANVPPASLAALRHVDPARLSSASADYLDAGRALADALAAASLAAVGGDRSGLVRFIRWVGPDVELPPAVLDRLGAIAAPHVGAFRPDRLDGAPGAEWVPDPIPELTEADAREYLEVAARSERSTVELRGALVAWAAWQIDAVHVDAGPPAPGALQQIGAVYRFVSDGGRRFAELRAAGEDSDHARRRWLLDSMASLAWGLPKRFGIGAAGEWLTGAAIDGMVGEGHHELDQLRSMAEHVRSDQEELEWLVLDRAVRRSQPGLPPPPDEIVAGGGLLALAELGERRLEAFRRWRDDPAVQAATGLNDAAASFNR